jgi:hypothetical protein
VRLSDEQLVALRACANNISLRFEEPRTVRALIEARYVSTNVAGVIRITAEGRHYLDAHDRDPEAGVDLVGLSHYRLVDSPVICFAARCPWCSHTVHR